MKFNCGETAREKRERLSQWHRHFLLFPVRLGSHDCRVFEWVWRKGEFIHCDFWDWYYKDGKLDKPK